MAKYNQGGGCSCGLNEKCDCGIDDYPKKKEKNCNSNRSH